MAIRMTEAREGSPDGIRVHEYEEGREYSATSRPPVSDDLAAVFVREGWAEEVTVGAEKSGPGPGENKALQPVSENKRVPRGKRGDA